MKKLFCLVLSLCLLPLFALADVPDISDLNNDDLLLLLQNIQRRLFDDHLVDGVSVSQGTYIVGEDIPAGVYRIEITGGTGYYELSAFHGGKLLNTGITGKSYNVTEIGKIVLSEGNELMIANSTFVFFPYTGIFH